MLHIASVAAADRVRELAAAIESGSNAGASVLSSGVIEAIETSWSVTPVPAMHITPARRLRRPSEAVTIDAVSDGSDTATLVYRRTSTGLYEGDGVALGVMLALAPVESELVADLLGESELELVRVVDWSADDVTVGDTASDGGGVGRGAPTAASNCDVVMLAFVCSSLTTARSLESEKIWRGRPRPATSQGLKGPYAGDVSTAVAAAIAATTAV